MGCAPSSKKKSANISNNNKPVKTKGIIAPQEQQQLLIEKELKEDLNKLNKPSIKVGKKANKKVSSGKLTKRKGSHTSSSSSSSSEDEAKNIPEEPWQEEPLNMIDSNNSHAIVRIPFASCHNNEGDVVENTAHYEITEEYEDTHENVGESETINKVLVETVILEQDSATESVNQPDEILSSSDTIDEVINPEVSMMVDTSEATNFLNETTMVSSESGETETNNTEPVLFENDSTEYNTGVELFAQNVEDIISHEENGAKITLVDPIKTTAEPAENTTETEEVPHGESDVENVLSVEMKLDDALVPNVIEDAPSVENVIEDALLGENITEHAPSVENVIEDAPSGENNIEDVSSSENHVEDVPSSENDVAVNTESETIAEDTQIDDENDEEVQEETVEDVEEVNEVADEDEGED